MRRASSSDGEMFRNEAWGKTGASLDPAIEAGIGRIDLRLADRPSFSVLTTRLFPADKPAFQPKAAPFDPGCKYFRDLVKLL